MGKIYFSTTAYNAEKTLCRCVDSVLNQTYRSEDIIYYFCDNGSTDRTGEMIREYAERDPRIRVFTNREGWVWEPQNREFLEFSRDLEDEDILCFLDSDDAYELNFLEELLPFLERNELDIAACGSVFLDAASNQRRTARVPKQPELFLSPTDFSDRFTVYHQYMRTTWGKIFVGKVARRIYTKETVPEHGANLSYGEDTFFVFSALRHARRIGIYNKELHRYYVSPKSYSYQWNAQRIRSDRLLYDDAMDYLSAFGPVSRENREFLEMVYSSAVTDTVDVLQKTAMAPADKLREYRDIALYPLTQGIYRACGNQAASESREGLARAALYAGKELKKQEDEDLRAIMRALFPRSGQAVSGANAELFLEDQALYDALLRDDAGEILENLLARLEGKQGVKKYAIPEAIQALAADEPLLCQIEDSAFLRKYPKIYQQVWQGEKLAALEEMTGLLLEDRVSGGRETFLQLYISLSALLEQAPAFVYGKLRLAQLYFRQKRLPECRAVVAELEEIGLADSEELDALRRDLETAGV